nr:reverse transcriptase domain-containing protein [Tanacetum cinerariifolium]
MNTHAEFMILSGGDNRPPMLEKPLYASWKSRMKLYMQNREHERMIIESVAHGPLIWLTIKENESCQGSMRKSPTTNASLPPEWSKFVTDVKLVRGLHTTNFDQLNAYLEQHELHANEVRVMRECNQDLLALVANHQMTPSHFNTYQSSYNNPQFQQQFFPSQSPQYGSIHPTQHYSTTYPSTPLAITYPLAPYPNIDSSLAVLVFKREDDPIDATNKMMSFMFTDVTSRFPSTNNQLRNSFNPRQQATIHDGRPKQFLWPICLVMDQMFFLSDFLLFKEANAFLGLEDDPDLPKLDPSYYDPKGDIQMLKAILNSDHAPSLPDHEQSVPSFINELKACKAKTIKSSVDEPPEVELKDLPPHIEYAFLKGDNKLPVIIAKELRNEEKSALIKVLKSHKRAIAWKLANISRTEGNNSGQQRVVKCFNCQGKGCMARQCLKPKRKGDATWFRDKVLLVKAQGSDDLDTYDSDCDEFYTAKAVLMANLSSYGSNVLFEVPHSKNTHNDMLNQSVQEISYSKQAHLLSYPENEITSNSNIIPYS